MKLIVDIEVTDLSRAVEFYSNQLGLKLRRQEQEWAAISIGDAEIHLYLHGGTTRDVEFYVEDILEEVKNFNERGVAFHSGINKAGAISVDENNITSFPWGRIAFFVDTEGNELALVQDN